jgi:multicomponent Na+:H+ antiporter subunit D
MLSHVLVINFFSPFVGAFAAVSLGIWHRRAALPIAIISISLSLISTLTTLTYIAFKQPIAHYYMGGWLPPYGIAFYVDGLNVFIIILIHLVALLSLIQAGPIIKNELGRNRHYYYALFLLFVVGVTGITQTADAFNLYVLIEVASLTSYALIATKGGRSVHAGFNYLLMGSVGATMYLLGVGYLYIKTGTLNMQDFHDILLHQGLISSPTVQVAIVLIMVGLWVKMAFFPLHGWLPNAYTFSPLPSTSLMAPLMTKVMIYVMIRVMLSLFGYEHILDLLWAKAVPYLAVAGILYGSFMALAQRNLRRVVTYIVVAEVGYMVGAAWLGTDLGLAASFFHILSDSLMTLCLFLVAGAIAYYYGIRNIDDFEGAFGKMPLTMSAFVVGALSMIGIPPTAGFFSKWYLVGAGIDVGNWIYVAALIVSSFVNAVIFFRIFEIAVFGKKPAEGHDAHHDHPPVSAPKESFKLSITTPALSAALLIMLLGIFNHRIYHMILVTIEQLNGGANL